MKDLRANKILLWGLEQISKETFTRGDYNKLVILTTVWLGGKDIMYSFKLSVPGAFHFARFVSQNLYFMTMGLVGHQMVDRGFLDQACVDKAERLLPYIALHDTPAFIMCPLAAGADYRDLEFIQGIRELKQQDKPIADRVLHSLTRQ